MNKGAAMLAAAAAMMMGAGDGSAMPAWAGKVGKSHRMSLAKKRKNKLQRAARKYERRKNRGLSC